MTERSMFWDGTADLTAVPPEEGGPYDQGHMMDTFFARIMGSHDDAGVLYNWLNDLEVTGTTSPVSVATGGAFVYGMFYENDEAVNVSVTTPTTARYDYVVLQRDWMTQTVRIARITGTAAENPIAPTLTQTAGITWEIPLALLYIDSGGTITVTDAREYLAFPTNWAEVPNIVTTTEIADNTITTDNIADRVRYEYKGAGQIEPDADSPCTWTSGQFDYWSFSSGDAGWVYFMVPVGYVSGTMEFYLYTAPVVAGAGDVEWTYNIYWGPATSSGGDLLDHTSSITPAQGARAIKTPNRDGLLWMRTGIDAGQIIAIKIARDTHGLDTFPNAMALYGVEMEWTADA